MKIGEKFSLRKLDFSLIILTLALSLFGLLMISSATRSSIRGLDTSYFVTKQAVWVFISYVVFFSMTFFDARKLRNYSYLLYILNIVLLASVFIFGEQKLGAQRWIQIGPVSFQPSEFAKLFMAIFLASFFANAKDGHISSRMIFYSFSYLVFPLFFILLQPDLGTAVVLLVMWVSMLIGAGARTRDIAIICIATIIVFAGAIQFGLLKEYQLKRLTTFISAGEDSSTGYNLKQAKIAIGSGGFTGKGLYAGTQTNLRFIPERHTDFIFAVIGEELGFLGVTSLLVVFLLLLFRVQFVAHIARDDFIKYFTYGFSSVFLFHIMVNVGMNIGLVPIAGIPLPFISSGGSFLIMNMAALGIIGSAWRTRFST